MSKPSGGAPAPRETGPLRVDWSRVLRLLAFFLAAGGTAVLLVLVYESLMVPISIAAKV